MPWLHRLHKIPMKSRGFLPWGLALLFFAASFALRILFDPFLNEIKFLTFYPAISATTLICGWRQGFLVLALSLLAGWYFFFEPTHSFAIKDATTIGALVGFLLVGAFILWLVAALRETIRRLEISKAAQETLSTEFQHRVANNLQLVVTLLRHAQRNLRNPVVAAQTLNEAEQRIGALSQLHRRLHDGNAFIYGLSPLLRELLKIAFRDLPVTYRVDVSDEADLSIDQMTAVVFLVNEAALNAAKHVFSRGLGARFDVSLSKDTTGHLRLVVRDDGPKMAMVIDAQTRSFGIGIMEGFARQLGGPLEVKQSEGTLLSVEFTAL